MACLSVIDLRTVFRDAAGFRLVTSEVCFGLGPGERISLIGESGTGKTVTVLALCGLLDTHPGLVRGQVFLDGDDLYDGLSSMCTESAEGGSLRVRKNRARFQNLLRRRVRPAARRAMGLIFQEARETLDPLRTVGSQLIEALEQKHTRKCRTTIRVEAEALLLRLGFEHSGKVLCSYPHELSGGMAQRIGIALALASRPSILIADEPTSALDAVLQRQVADLILEVQEKDHWALLLITHNLRLAEYMTDRILVMYGGQIIEMLPSRHLSESGHRLHPYTEQLRDAVSDLYGQRLTIPESPEAPGDPPSDEPLRLLRATPQLHTPCPFASCCSMKNQVPGRRLGLCDREMPEFSSLEGEEAHLVRCWLY